MLNILLAGIVITLILSFIIIVLNSILIYSFGKRILQREDIKERMNQTLN